MALDRALLHAHRATPGPEAPRRLASRRRDAEEAILVQLQPLELLG